MYRRKTWSRKPSRSYGARRGGRTHAVTRVQRWETAVLAGQLNLIVPAAGGMVLSYMTIASIALSLGNGGSSPESTIGTVLAGMNRAIIVGGIVYDWSCYYLGNFNNDNLDRAQGEFMMTHQLITDRLINDGGPNFPASLGSYDPFTPMFPMSSLSTTQPTVDPNALPTRIHHTKYFPLLSGARTISNPAENTLYVPDDQKLNPSFGTVNKRLRIRLDDEQGLFFCTGLKAGEQVEGNLGQSIRFNYNGRLYYRFLQ